MSDPQEELELNDKTAVTVGQAMRLGNARYDAGLERGAAAERERIVKLLREIGCLDKHGVSQEENVCGYGEYLHMTCCPIGFADRLERGEG